jgi:diketogulonate reductase-like aldo/keto reductase
VVANVPFGGRGGRTLAAVQGKPLLPWAAEIGRASWAQRILKAAALHPATTCVVSGSTKVSRVEDNQLAARGELSDTAIRRRMEKYWDALG